jgi:type IV pilus assembly protein PilE
MPSPRPSGAIPADAESGLRAVAAARSALVRTAPYGPTGAAAGDWGGYRSMLCARNVQLSPSARHVRAFRGFTLIELIITVLIVSILATIAVTSYRFAVIKSNRRAAQGFMMDVALRENQVLLDRRSYASLADLGVTVPSDVSKAYTVTLTTSAGPPPTYTITATPVAGSMQAGDGTLTLNAEGVKSPPDKW